MVRARLAAVMIAGLVCAGLAPGLIGGAWAQGIPLPPKKPAQPAPSAQPAQTAQPAQPGQTGQPARPRPAINEAALRPGPVRPPGDAVPYMPYDGAQRALIDRISAYLSSVQTLSGDFVQIGPDGGRAVGKFYIQKPGRVRFEYQPPSAVNVIADGSVVVVRDRRLATQDLYLPAGVGAA